MDMEHKIQAWPVRWLKNWRKLMNIHSHLAGFFLFQVALQWLKKKKRIAPKATNKIGKVVMAIIFLITPAQPQGYQLGCFFGINGPLSFYFNFFQFTVIKKFHSLPTSTHLNLLQPMLAKICLKNKISNSKIIQKKILKKFPKKIFFKKNFKNKSIFQKNSTNLNPLQFILSK